MARKPTIGKQQRNLELASARLHHVEKLIEVLGDPSEWEYRDEWADGGRMSQEKCSCGQTIRYLFIIHHPIKGRAQVGSTCVNHFAVINPALYERMKAGVEAMEKTLAAEKAEVKRKAKAAQDNATVESLKEQYVQQYDELYCRKEAIALDATDRTKSNNRAWQFSMLGMLNGVFHPQYEETYVLPPRFVPPKYKTPRGYINWYSKQLERLQRAFDVLDKKPEDIIPPF